MRRILTTDLRVGYQENSLVDKMDFFNHLTNNLKHEVLENLEEEMKMSSQQRFEQQDFIEARQFINKLKETDKKLQNFIEKVQEK